MPTQIDQKNEFLNYLFCGQGHSQTGTWWAGLLLDLPDGTPGNEGTEVVGNNYARKEIEFNLSTNGEVNNLAEVEFPPAIPAGWGIVIAVGLYDDETAGNLKFYVPCAGVDVTANMICRILQEELYLVGV